MYSAALTALLDELIATWENEVVEFKQAGDGFSTDDIGKYFSALANEANLRGGERAWLVFRVHNQTRTVVGTDYRRRTRATAVAEAANCREHHAAHHFARHPRVAPGVWARCAASRGRWR